jgi:hypothetical protein
MTKAQEIDLLHEFIGKLPKDSYLWPWLVSVEAEAVADIRNDCVVSPSIAETRKRCDQMLADAANRAAQIIADAERKAEQATDNTRKWRESVRSSLASQLESARRTLLGYS